MTATQTTMFDLLGPQDAETNRRHWVDPETKQLERDSNLTEYIRKHPAAYEAFVRETRAALSNGEAAGKIGAKAIAERCRHKIKSGIDNRYVTGMSRLCEEKLGREIFRKRKKAIEVGA